MSDTDMHCLACHGRGLDKYDHPCRRCDGTGLEPDPEDIRFRPARVHALSHFPSKAEPDRHHARRGPRD